MQISQTYLGSSHPRAKLFVYYLWEDYKEQEDVPEAVIRRLDQAGWAFGKDVSLTAPSPGSLDNIRSEIRPEGKDSWWWQVGQNTPGLLLTTKPFGKFRPTKDECIFFSLPHEAARSEDAYEAIFEALHDQCERMLAQKSGGAVVETLSVIYEAIEMKPSVFGFGIDLKKLITRLTQ